MPSLELWQRKYELRVDTLVVKDATLRVAFDIEKTNKPEPNNATIRIWNLNEDHRKALDGKDGVQVSLQAGYQDGMSTLYLGDLRQCLTFRDGPDFVTEISSGDGEKAINTSRISQSFGPGTPIDAVLTALVKSLGVGPGNSARIGAELRAKGVTLFKTGAVLSGRVSSELTHVANSVGLEWSVQDGAVQFLLKGKALETTAIVLRKNTGLVGIPSVNAKKKLEFQALLIPDLYPGRLLMLDSENVKGLYRVETARYSGDTRAQDWYVYGEANAVG